MAVPTFDDVPEQVPARPSAGPLTFDDVPAAAPAAAPAPTPTPEPTPVPRREAAPPGPLTFEDVKGTSDAMPGIAEAAGRGFVRGIKGVGKTTQALSGVTPEAQEATPESQPFEWADLWSPVTRGAPKVAHMLGESSPTLAGGIMGGLAGAATPVPGGALIGGAGGATIGTIAQSLGPIFAEELKKTPNDPEGAWSRSMTSASISGVASGAGWAAYPLKAFSGPVKQLLFQAFGVQAPIMAGAQMAQNVAAGEDVTKDVLQHYLTGAAFTSVPAAGHALLSLPMKGRVAPLTTDPDINAVLNRIGEQDKSFSIPSFNRLYTAIKDDLHPLREVEKYLSEGNTIPMELRPYILARLTRGSAGKSTHFLDHGTFDPITGADRGKGMKQILEPINDDLDGFRAYMLSRRAIEKEGQGIQTGVPLTEAQNVVQKGSAKFAQPFKEWVQYQKDLLRYMVRSGIIGKDSYKAMLKANKDYTPFYRLLEDESHLATHPGEGLKVRDPIHGMDGSLKPILDPIESTIRNTFMFISLADRNLALQALENMVLNSPKGSDIMKKVPQKMHPVNVTGKEATTALAKQGKIAIPDDPEGFTIFRPNAFRPAPDEIAIFRDGKRNVYKADPYLASAVNGLDRESAHMLTKILSVPAKTLRAGATLSPEFISRNPIRDQFSAFIYSALGRGYAPFYDLFLGAASVWKQDQNFKNWLKGGGANSALVSIDRDYVKNLVSRMRDPSFMSTIANVVTSPLELLRATSELAENATRVGEHRRLMKRGATPTEASFASREITLDFQRIGSKMRAANQMIAFFNAQVEGVDRTARALWDNPKRAAATIAASITLPSLYLAWANNDDPRVKEIPRWQKDLFWILPTDKWEPATQQQVNAAPKGWTRQNNAGQWEINNGTIWRVPKPFELGIIFGSIPERIFEAAYNRDPNAFKNLPKTVWEAFMPNFVPQAVGPLIEQYSNRSLFTDRPLIPHYLEGMVPQTQYNPYTTDTAKMIGNTISKIPGMSDNQIASPIMVENWVRAWFGGLGRHMLDVSDFAMREMGIVPSKISPTPTAADKAIIKAFAVRFPEAGASSIQDFYDEFNKRGKVKKSITHLMKIGETADAAELQRENIITSATAIQKALSAQMKMVRDAYRSPKMSPEQKRQFIDMSYMQMIQMAQIGNIMFKKTQDLFEEQKKLRSQ